MADPDSRSDNGPPPEDEPETPQQPSSDSEPSRDPGEPSSPEEEPSASDEAPGGAPSGESDQDAAAPANGEEPTLVPAAERGKGKGKKEKKKRGFLRTWFRTGLLSVLLLALLLCLGFYFFLFDPLLHWALQRYGSQALGAKLEVESVRTSLFPATMVLTEVRATNPTEPMRNATEFAEAVATFDPFALLSGRVIIDELVLRGLRFDTPRETSGALEREPPIAEVPDPDEDLEPEPGWLDDLETPDIERILREEDLESVRLAAQTDQDIREGEERWRQRIEELKERWAEREREIRELAEQDDPAARLRAARELAAKIEQIRKDIEELRAVRRELEQDVAAFRERKGEIQQAVPQDAAHLREKYATGPEGLANAAEALFGEPAGLWARRAAMAWPYVQAMRARSAERAAQPPPPARGSGRYVSFADETVVAEVEPPRPRIVIGRVHFSAETDLGALAGEALNLTDMPSVLGRPAQVDVSAETPRGLRSFVAHALLDHVRPESPEDSIEARIRGLALRDLDLSGPAKLAEGAADIDLDIDLRGQTLEGLIRVAVENARFAAKEEGLGEAAQAIVSALAGVSRFVLDATVGGTVDRPQLKVRSDELENAVGGAMAAFAKEQAERFEAELNQEIADQVGERMGALEERLAVLEGMDGDMGTLIEQAIEMTRESGGRGLLEGLRGRQEAEPDGPEAEQEEPPVRDRIRGILGR